MTTKHMHLVLFAATPLRLESMHLLVQDGLGHLDQTHLLRAEALPIDSRCDPCST